MGNEEKIKKAPINQSNQCSSYVTIYQENGNKSGTCGTCQLWDSCQLPEARRRRGPGPQLYFGPKSERKYPNN